jgi:uroporphyrinogen decarboxylase
MIPKERMLITMRHGMADRVPVAPDMSNMIPARLTGKPFWDIYLYQDPPLWKAYIDAVKYFGFDGFLDYQVRVAFPDEIQYPDPSVKTVIVQRTDERIVTRSFREEDCLPRSIGGKRTWYPHVSVYPRDNPPTGSIHFSKVGLLETPDAWEPIEGVKQWPTGEELFELAYGLMGDSGVVGITCGTSLVVNSEVGLYHYMDDPDVFRERSRWIIEASKKRMENISRMRVRPDYVSCGGSGTLIWQSLDIFRDVSLPVVQEVTRLCKEAGIVSHIHSCGPEKELVRICAEETNLDVIDPLEVPPMGDSILPELKEQFGDRLVLKGNLHTTEVMFRGSRDDVIRASRQAIEDAAAGGNFILSTGDQCGRDTPDENIKAMIEAVEEFGRYD